MYATHDYVEEKKCAGCGALVPYYEVVDVLGKLVCEYCLDEMYQPEDI